VRNQPLDPLNCPFCKISKHELPAVTIIEDDAIITIMDLYPATPGHILIIPKQHIENIYMMPPDVGSHIMKTAIVVAKAIEQKLRPDGLNLIQANGTAAGQTIPHFHLHLVPRYKDDPVYLEFGHGILPADKVELEDIASKLRSGLNK
jgi:histidine triad (HIT) family protein